LPCPRLRRPFLCLRLVVLLVLGFVRWLLLLLRRLVGVFMRRLWLLTRQ